MRPKRWGQKHGTPPLSHGRPRVHLRSRSLELRFPFTVLLRRRTTYRNVVQHNLQTHHSASAFPINPMRCVGSASSSSRRVDALGTKPLRLRVRSCKPTYCARQRMRAKSKQNIRKPTSFRAAMTARWAHLKIIRLSLQHKMTLKL